MGAGAGKCSRPLGARVGGVVGTSKDSSRKFAGSCITWVCTMRRPLCTHRSGSCAIIDAGLALPAGDRQADLVAGVAAQARSARLVGVAGLVLLEAGREGSRVHGWVGVPSALPRCLAHNAPVDGRDL